MDGNFLQTDSSGEKVGRERELWGFIWWGKLEVGSLGCQVCQQHGRYKWQRCRQVAKVGKGGQGRGDWMVKGLGGTS